MRIAVPRETARLERRVALVPDGVTRLVKAGHEVAVESGAGESAGFADELYVRAGAAVGSRAATFGGAQVVVKVQRPAPDEVDLLEPGSTLIALMAPATAGDLLERLAGRGITTFAMELVPRTTKAQSMDALSSQATVAGYKAVLVGAGALPRFLPMLTTAAGTIAPARVFIIGAGVAGLQAIATARRLGGVVSAFDVRPAVREQVQSLGASFVEPGAAAEGAGGYAKELAADEQARVLAAVATHIRDMDLVITTAQIPGRPAPLLVTRDMLGTMRPGSVIVDLAAESGGNCEVTRPDEIVSAGGVSVIGPVNLASTLPFHASQMYGRNILTFLEYLIRDGTIPALDDDPIAGPMRLA
jgi:H+-translocating NAD(P) transhydrogenase subunit alpha